MPVIGHRVNSDPCPAASAGKIIASIPNLFTEYTLPACTADQL